MFEIYVIENDFSSKTYIGQTTQGIQKRFNQHKHNTESRIGRSIQYHGVNHYSIKVIDTAETQEEADTKERLYIKQYDSINDGYNLQPGGVLDYGSDYEQGVGVHVNIAGNRIKRKI